MIFIKYEMATTTAIISQSFAMRNLSGAILKLSCRSSGKGFRPNINRNKILKSKVKPEVSMDCATGLFQELSK